MQLFLLTESGVSIKILKSCVISSRPFPFAQIEVSIGVLLYGVSLTLPLDLAPSWQSSHPEQSARLTGLTGSPYHIFSLGWFDPDSSYVTRTDILFLQSCHIPPNF